MSVQAYSPTAIRTGILSTPNCGPTRGISDSCDVSGTHVTFPDASVWLIEEPISEMKFQRTSSPCEATQVFAVRCSEDPLSNYHVGDEAVIKIKFQIKAWESTERDYQKWIAECEDSLSTHPDISVEARKDNEDCLKEINYARLSIHYCTHPTREVHQNTVNEIFALRNLADQHCQHAPWVLDFAELSVMPGDHPLGIVGGYYVVTLMTKVPGIQLTWQYLSDLSPAERDEIREAFKVALMDVWDCGVLPHDSALRNIIWDPEERKCYIIDYEESTIVKGEAQIPKEFTDVRFAAWGLAERRFSGPNSF